MRSGLPIETTFWSVTELLYRVSSIRVKQIFLFVRFAASVSIDLFGLTHLNFFLIAILKFKQPVFN